MKLFLCFAFVVQVFAYPRYINCNDLTIVSGRTHANADVYTSPDIASLSGNQVLTTLVVEATPAADVCPGSDVALVLTNDVQSQNVIHATGGTFSAGGDVAYNGEGACTGTNSIKEISALTSLSWTAPATEGTYQITAFSTNAGMANAFNRGRRNIVVNAAACSSDPEPSNAPDESENTDTTDAPTPEDNKGSNLQAFNVFSMLVMMLSIAHF